MAFGQPSGPPATAKQLAQLLELLQQAGHESFREARGPLGFTQRQGGGKFTRDEAEAYILELSTDTESGDVSGAPEAVLAAPAAVPKPKTLARPSAGSTAEAALRRIPSEHLAAELQRRGWIVMEP